MPVFEVPLSATPQQLTITLAGITYNLALRWNDGAGAWVIDIYDVNQVAVLVGIPLVTGVDLLEQYAYLDFGGTLIAQLDNSQDPPTYDSLGTTGHLYFVTSS